MRIDPYNHKEKYVQWKEKTKSGIDGISTFNSVIIKEYIQDMEDGLNVATGSKKGSRSFVRLNMLRQRMVFLAKEFEKRLCVDRLIDANESQIFNFFSEMRNGTIARADGKVYKSAKDFVKDYKAFWHWHQKKNRKKGIEIADITLDLDTSGEKPEWVYITDEQVKMLTSAAIYDYKVLIWFLFDSGIRAPTELMNVKVSDFYNDFKELNIRQETSKTFGRRIKLLICSNLIKEYIQTKNLGKDDYLFTTSPAATNKYLKRLGKRVLGDEKSEAGAKYSQLTMYDFRHCSCCYWLPRYKSESALKYRFGWKKSDKIHYYSELLGMKDTISEEDMLVDVTKIDLERRLDKSDKEKEILKDEIADLRLQIAKIGQLTNRLYKELKEGSGEIIIGR